MKKYRYFIDQEIHVTVVQRNLCTSKFLTHAPPSPTPTIIVLDSKRMLSLVFMKYQYQDLKEVLAHFMVRKCHRKAKHIRMHNYFNTNRIMHKRNFLTYVLDRGPESDSWLRLIALVMLFAYETTCEKSETLCSIIVAACRACCRHVPPLAYKR